MSLLLIGTLIRKYHNTFNGIVGIGNNFKQQGKSCKEIPRRGNDTEEPYDNHTFEAFPPKCAVSYVDAPGKRPWDSLITMEPKCIKC